jgi:hypothetical protein
MFRKTRESITTTVARPARNATLVSLLAFACAFAALIVCAISVALVNR